MIRCCILALLFFASTQLMAENIIPQKVIKSVRIWPSPDSTRVVFDLDQAASYSYQFNEAQLILSIDFVATKLNTDLNKRALANTKIRKLQARTIANNNLQIVLELDQKLQPKIFTLPPNEMYGHRLVLDLEKDEKQEILALFDLDYQNYPNQPIAPTPQSQVTFTSNAKIVIALDPGHGGDDPGAVGPGGTKEKHIALQIALQLQELINKQPGMKAVLTRTGDYYLGFRERMRRARAQRADLFVSIHADSFMDPNADGASVFVISSDKKASVAARWLARSENRADTVGGVRLSDKSDMLASVLLDLTQNANAVASMDAARHVLSALGKSTTLHKNRVESGGFLVLRSPDIPSILVEAGFLSNRKTEQKLRDKHYQQKIAAAILQGIETYFKHDRNKHRATAN